MRDIDHDEQPEYKRIRRRPLEAVTVALRAQPLARARIAEARAQSFRYIVYKQRDPYEQRLAVKAPNAGAVLDVSDSRLINKIGTAPSTVAIADMKLPSSAVSKRHSSFRCLRDACIAYTNLRPRYKR